jgi:hypothetical protein
VTDVPGPEPLPDLFRPASPFDPGAAYRPSGSPPSASPAGHLATVAEQVVDWTRLLAVVVGVALVYLPWANRHFVAYRT